MTQFLAFPTSERSFDLPTPASTPTRKRRSITQLVDAAALALYPLLLRVFGYTLRVGQSTELAHDGHAVLRAVWAEKGVAPPSDVAWIADRYDRATTWILCYHRGRPVGVMGLLDMRIASVALDYSGRLVPPGLPLDATREIGRLGILREHRGRAQMVMIGLVLRMFSLALTLGLTHLFSGSTPALFRMYQRFNPTARLVDPPHASSEDPDKTRYFAPLRAYGGEGVLYTFEVAGGSPSSVVRRYLSTRLRGKGSRGSLTTASDPATTSRIVRA
jgi:hypothetical protein